ncbi:hypothetical protein C8J57DRAFT_1298689 [Mycena rebaudengoi]|nr:hypothetical protein C8J57DRAFT_1298689 [Mycena rebaudengoi]
MFSKLVSMTLLTVLAGRALAFNVSVNKVIFQANETLKFVPSPIYAACDAQCNTAQQIILACPIDDLKCYCDPNLVVPLQTCEQCVFTALVVANKPAPEPRAGSNQVLAGWNSNCMKNFTITPPLGLTLPASWDGPFVSEFPEAIGSIIATIGGLLGITLIYSLCQM